MKTDLTAFASRLKSLRIETHLTQPDMAEILGITIKQYQRYEYSKSFPRFADLIALADYFNVSLDYLCGRSEEK